MRRGSQIVFREIRRHSDYRSAGDDYDEWSEVETGNRHFS
jgi:hypothetical protein